MLIQGSGFPLNLFVPNWMCRRTHRTHHLPYLGRLDRTSRRLVLHRASPPRLAAQSFRFHRRAIRLPNTLSSPTPYFSAVSFTAVSNSQRERAPISRQHTVIHRVLLEKANRTADLCMEITSRKIFSSSIHFYFRSGLRFDPLLKNVAFLTSAFLTSLRRRTRRVRLWQALRVAFTILEVAAEL
jgi:hypothetical protein